MANTSQTRGKFTPADFSFSIELPQHSFIKRFIAVYSPACGWSLMLETEAGQIATICNPSNGFTRYFEDLDSLALWLSTQGVPEMTVFLPALSMGGRD
ncbi:hypothetical protein THMIRHAS_12420 [Thiosulfatimonas sediminis]|uniref:Uncharacterized protein n=1 Tax=Thiosulfatimonas sediminis TaxID=2675054 RepID=A0A6F8PUS8_9GAMM|nr:hypothetical protein [Thiosulfatimonas sediminis]BBP45869.1 hypothetical protein THMIRHAS_12420 [Thiosulfatimonas sediminis]